MPVYISIIKNISDDISISRLKADNICFHRQKNLDDDPQLFLVDEDISLEKIQPSHAICVIRAPNHDLEIIADAIRAVNYKPTLIGVELEDFIALSSACGGVPLFGCSAVILGLYEDQTVSNIKQTVERFSQNGFNGGCVLVRAIAVSDDGRAKIHEVDRVACDVFSSGFSQFNILTAFLHAQISGWIVVAFRNTTDAHN